VTGVTGWKGEEARDWLSLLLTGDQIISPFSSYNLAFSLATVASIKRIRVQRGYVPVNAPHPLKLIALRGSPPPTIRFFSMRPLSLHAFSLE